MAKNKNVPSLYAWLFFLYPAEHASEIKGGPGGPLVRVLGPKTPRGGGGGRSLPNDRHS